MNAKILDFQKAVRSRNKSSTANSLTIDESVTMAIMDRFKSCPIISVEEGIKSARSIVENGGGFIDAMDKASETIQAVCSKLVHETSLSIIHIQEILSISDILVRCHLPDSSDDEIEQARQKARRVLLGGGSLLTAIYLATKN